MINNGKKNKVLIVDDSDVILHTLKDFFEDYNFEVITCSDGLEGIQKAAEEKPDLIILDLMMPNIDGIKMLQVKNVLKDIQNIPVLVISANTAKRNVMAALEAGAHRVISKPLDQQLIIKYVNEILGGSMSSSANVKNQLNDNDKFEIKRNVLKFFIDSFDIKKRMISDALKTKDAEKLKTVLHEIKGAGGTIGYPELTNISKEIEDKEFKLTTDWVFAEIKCDRLFKEVQQIEKEFNNN